MTFIHRSENLREIDFKLWTCLSFLCFQCFLLYFWMQGSRYRLTSFVKGSQRDGNNWLECWALAPNMFFDVKVKTSRKNYNKNICYKKCTTYIIETWNLKYIMLLSFNQSLYWMDKTWICYKSLLPEEKII